MTTTGSISVSGLLGGTAGQIDTVALINQLMSAQSIPQQLLKDQLSTVTSQLSAYQTIAGKLTGVQAAAQAVTDPTAWQATTATSSSSVVAATSSATASPGSTTFSVTQLARAQVTTIAADSSGTVVSVPSSGIRLTDSAGMMHSIALTSGSAADVASAINAANLGVRASVVQTNNGTILQVTSTRSGAANGFALAGTDAAPSTAVPAQDAQVTIGDPANGGYTINSASNTFTGVIGGVTFSASALATDVTVTVGSDEQSISTKVAALVSAANSALGEISTDTAKGAVLQGTYDTRAVATSLTNTVSGGTSSLKPYGIDLASDGTLSFDPTAFAAAYAADPSGTQAAVSSGFAAPINTATTAAIAPVTGTLTTAIAAGTSRTDDLNTDISSWSTRLADIRSNLQLKYSAMESALAQLQSQQTYLTSMLAGISGKSSTTTGS